jgi:hypothetical protein
MTRRLSSSFLSMILFASVAWPKMKPEDQQYFDNQFHAQLEQVQALSKQVQTLATRLAEANQNQVNLQEALVKQQRALEALAQLVSSMRSSSDENLASLKAALDQMRAETEKSLTTQAGRSTETTAFGTAASPSAVQAYITIVRRNEVVVNQGSGKGLHVGSRLGLYKAGDPNTRAGALEVTQIVDAGNSRAKVLSTTAGVRPEFGDIVRPE